MKRLLSIGLLMLLGLSAFGARHIGMETESFRCLVQVETNRNVVFSPASFELDCALIAESIATIPKAALSEWMGVTIDFEGTYSPIIEALLCRTNGWRFLTARAFCVPNIEKAQPAHRQMLERIYGAEVMPMYPREGAQAWLRAKVEGEMEDFELENDPSRADRFSFYDLVAVNLAWQEPFPTSNTRKLQFVAIDGKHHDCEFMTDVRNVEAYETKNFSMLKLPMKGGVDFYALMPKSGVPLEKVQSALAAERIDGLLVATKSIAMPGVVKGPAVVVLPKLEYDTKLDIMPVLAHFHVPIVGLTPVAADASAHACVQRVKFSLAEHGIGEAPLVKKPEAEQLPVTKDIAKFIFNRPFVFFAYHPETATVLVAGQFTGKEL